MGGNYQAKTATTKPKTYRDIDNQPLYKGGASYWRAAVRIILSVMGSGSGMRACDVVWRCKGQRVAKPGEPSEKIRKPNATIVGPFFLLLILFVGVKRPTGTLSWGEGGKATRHRIMLILHKPRD